MILRGDMKQFVQKVLLILVISLPTPQVANAQSPDLVDKKWVIEGIWRGWNALYLDSMDLTQRVVPRKHDYFEFYADSTFHFNYFNRSSSSGLINYQKTFWDPGRFEFDESKNRISLIFDDDKVELLYKVILKPENSMIWLNQKPDKN